METKESKCLEFMGFKVPMQFQAPIQADVRDDTDVCSRILNVNYVLKCVPTCISGMYT